jgi:tRNA-5-methyluridine54 2-sulfurtransferase
MNIERKVFETIKEYDLIERDEKIAVALSGGKDSTSVLYILKKLGYDVVGLMIDLNLGEWSKTHNKKMIKFCNEQNVPLVIIDLKKELGQGICFIKAVLKKQKNLTGCSVCGTIKRWLLNKYAKKLGVDKLVTGHNLDDEAQNVLMNFLKGNILLGINSQPKTGGGKVKGFAQRIKPLFFVPESEILEYAKKKEFDILYDKCPCAFGTYRVDTRDFTKGLTNSQKLKIVKNFQDIIPRLKRDVKSELRECQKCGEPTRSDLCNFCKIIGCVS